MWRAVEMERKEIEDNLSQKVNRLDEKNSELVDEIALKRKIIDLMHLYNETKDATQTVIGILANINRVTIKTLHEELELPSE